MENRQKQTEKIYKAALEAVINNSGELEFDMDTTLDGVALAIATLMAEYEKVSDDSFTIDMMAGDFRRRIIRSYNAIRRAEQQDTEQQDTN